jgi:hypothetical protein
MFGASNGVFAPMSQMIASLFAPLLDVADIARRRLSDIQREYLRMPFAAEIARAVKPARIPS